MKSSHATSFHRFLRIDRRWLSETASDNNGAGDVSLTVLKACINDRCPVKPKNCANYRPTDDQSPCDVTREWSFQETIGTYFNDKEMESGFWKVRTKLPKNVNQEGCLFEAGAEGIGTFVGYVGGRVACTESCLYNPDFVFDILSGLFQIKYYP